MKKCTQEEYKQIINLKPEDRVQDSGDPLTNKIWGILLAYGKKYHMREWFDIITTRDATKEIKELLDEYKSKE